MTLFLQSVFDGLSASGLFCVLALGLTMSYGISRVVNFAHGAFMALGGLIAVSVDQRLGGSGQAFLVATLAGIGVTAALAAVADRSIFRRAYSNPMVGLIVSIGLVIVMENLMTQIWGPNGGVIAPILTGTVHIGGAYITDASLAALLIAAAILALYFSVLRFTSIGAIWRAMSEDAEGTAFLGVHVQFHRTLNFVVGTSLAGLAGALLLLTGAPVTPLTGDSYIPIAFAAVIIGGAGNPVGAVVAALIIGFGQAFAGIYGNPAYVDVVAMLLLVAVLIVRPQGLWPTSEVAW